MLSLVRLIGAVCCACKRFCSRETHLSGYYYIILLTTTLLTVIVILLSTVSFILSLCVYVFLVFHAIHTKISCSFVLFLTKTKKTRRNEEGWYTKSNDTNYKLVSALLSCAQVRLSTVSIITIENQNHKLLGKISMSQT